MFSRILVPVDTSPAAERAVGQAVGMARASGGSIELVLVHRANPVAVGDWDDEQAKDDDWYVESLADTLAQQGVPTTFTIQGGDAVSRICARAAEVRADIIVMTSHGSTGASKTWLGSVTDGVVHHATCPVLVLRSEPRAGPPHKTHHPFRRIVVPLDGSPSSNTIIPVVAQLARCSAAEVLLVRVVQPAPCVRQDLQLERSANALRAMGVMHVDVHLVEHERTAQALLDFARLHDADVIALSTHGAGRTRMLLGSTADKVLRGSRTSVMLRYPADVNARCAQLLQETDVVVGNVDTHFRE